MISDHGLHKDHWHTKDDYIKQREKFQIMIRQLPPLESKHKSYIKMNDI